MSVNGKFPLNGEDNQENPQLYKAASVLMTAEEVCLACHLHPDPDALGSMFALAETLQRAGIKVRCSWGDDPIVVPLWVLKLGLNVPVVSAREFPRNPEVMVALDAAGPDRLGQLKGSAANAKNLVVIDHHVTNRGFGTVPVVDSRASSSAELVYRLILAMGMDLTDRTAAYLYAGMVADTGRFQYEAATPQTLKIAAALRERNFDHVRLAHQLFEDESYAYLKVASLVLSRAVLRQDVARGVVWSYLMQEDLADSGLTLKDTDNLIDLIRMTREADVSCIIKQQRSGSFSVSLRSHGDTDVGAVAVFQGGGGHQFASGYTSKAPLEETVNSVISALQATSPLSSEKAA